MSPPESRKPQQDWLGSTCLLYLPPPHSTAAQTHAFSGPPLPRTPYPPNFCLFSKTQLKSPSSTGSF